MRTNRYALLALAAGAAVAALVTSPAASASASGPVSFYATVCPEGNCFLYDIGPGNYAYENGDAYSSFYTTGGTGKWTELIDTETGACLEQYGDTGSSALVTEAYCNGRPAELWWITAGGGQVINDFGTSEANHDACMWSNGSGQDVGVKNCVPGGSEHQKWNFEYLG